MNNDFLFSYMIDSLKTEVYSLASDECTRVENNGFYLGLTRAVAQYLYYPYDIIAPRARAFKVQFVYDATEAEKIALRSKDYIAECTKEAFLNYMEESEELAK